MIESSRKKPDFKLGLVLGLVGGLILALFVVLVTEDVIQRTMIANHSGYYDPKTNNFVYKRCDPIQLSW